MRIAPVLFITILYYLCKAFLTALPALNPDKTNLEIFTAFSVPGLQRVLASHIWFPQTRPQTDTPFQGGMARGNRIPYQRLHGVKHCEVKTTG